MQGSKFGFFSAFESEVIAALMQLKWRSLMNSKFPLNRFRFIALSQLSAVTAVLRFIQNRNCSCFDLNDAWLLRKENHTIVWFCLLSFKNHPGFGDGILLVPAGRSKWHCGGDRGRNTLRALIIQEFVRPLEY